MTYNKIMKQKIVIIFVVVAVISAFLFVFMNFFVYKKKYVNFVGKYSDQYNLEPELVYSIIKVESDFDKNAVSKSNAMGLMQIIPSTASWIAESLGEQYDSSNLFDPETNIKYGCYYLNYLFSKFKSTDVVICAYNAGEVAVKNWLDENDCLVRDKISYSETKNYLNRVEKFYNVYKSDKIFL